MSAVILELEQRQSVLGRTWMIFMGIINFAQAFYVQNILRYIDIVFGIVLLAGGFYFWKIYKPKAVTFDDSGIRGRIGLGKNLKLQWNEVSSVEVAMYTISILPTKGKHCVIDLSNITYQKHQEVKPKIAELAKSKGVEVIAH